MSDSALTHCDPVIDLESAQAPVLTSLLPVAGLRRDLSGNLTEDSLSTVIEGIKSLGVVINSESTKLAVLQEAKNALCKINAQYEYLLSSLLSSIARSETDTIDPKMFGILKEKNQAMQDVLSVSRQIMTMPVDEIKEGFLGYKADPFANFREAFQTMDKTVAKNAEAIRSGKFKPAEERSLEVSQEKIHYAERLTNMYGLLNVTAIGLLFYIMFTD